MELLNQAFHRIASLRDEAEAKGLEIRFVPCVSRKFEPLIIVDVTETEKQMEVSLSLTSLYGYNGILPDYFSDEILREPRSGLKRFLDMFTHRQFELQLDIWAKHQFFAANTLDADQDRYQQMDQVVLALSGMGTTDSSDLPLFSRGLTRCLVGLFQRRAKTPMGLKFLLTQFFGPLDFRIEQHTVTYRWIPEKQQTRLGADQAKLGARGNFTAGNRMEDSDGCFSLTIADLNLETFYQFLPGGEAHQDLIHLLSSYTGNRWDTFLNLILRAEDVPSWQFGQMRLGSDTWALSEASYQDAFVAVGRIGEDQS